jgi:chromate transporter
MSAVTDEAVDEARPRPASLGELFFRLALQGFGGVLPVAQRELVERLGWVTRAEFIEVLSLGQVLPGPNVVNLALMLGDRFFGLRGALAALGGMLAAPLVIVLVLTAAYAELAGIAVVAGALRGMGAVAAGLILATAIRLMSTLRASLLGPWLAAAFVVVTFVTIAIVRLPLIWVVIGLGGVAIAIAWWQLR